MRLLLVSLFAAGTAISGIAAASEQSVQQLNVPVRDVNQACKLYSALGFEANKDCETCHVVVMTRDGVRMTLWPDVEGARGSASSSRYCRAYCASTPGAY